MFNVAGWCCETCRNLLYAMFLNNINDYSKRSYFSSIACNVTPSVFTVSKVYCAWPEAQLPATCWKAVCQLKLGFKFFFNFVQLIPPEKEIIFIECFLIKRLHNLHTDLETFFPFVLSAHAHTRLSKMILVEHAQWETKTMVTSLKLTYLKNLFSTFFILKPIHFSLIKDIRTILLDID